MPSVNLYLKKFWLFFFKASILVAFMEEWRFGGSLPNWTEVCLPNTCSKANFLTQDCGERKYSIYCKAPSKEYGQLMLRRHKLPDGFQGSVLKTVRECGGGEVTECVVHSYTVLCLVDSEVIGWSFKNLNHRSSGFNQSGVYMLVVSMQLTSFRW